MGWSTTGDIYAGNGAIDDGNFELNTDLGPVNVEIYFRQSDLSAIAAGAWEIWKAGPYDTQARKPIEPEYKYLKHGHNVTVQYDSGLTLSKWYWYRARWIDIDGRTGIFRAGQIQFV